MKKKLNQNSYNLFPLFVIGLFSFIKNLFIKHGPIQFPKKIGDYRFDSEISGVKLWNSYILGIYRNSKGSKAIFKMKDARIKDLHYYSLKNEIAIYDILNKATSRFSSSTPKKFHGICFPNKIAVKDTQDILGILIEYIEGKRVSELSPRKKVEIYFDIIEFLGYIDNHLTDKERGRISRRGPVHYLILFPFLAIKAILTYPRSAIFVLSGIPFFLAAIFVMLRDRKIALIHRDIHFENILISNKKLVLIDLEQCVLTDPFYEAVTTLRYYWKKDNFYLLLLDSVLQKYSFRKNFRLLFKGLIVNSATHGLTGKKFPKEMIDSWIDFLKYGVLYSDNVKKV